MEKENNLQKGRAKGSKNKKVTPLRELIKDGLTKGLMLAGFTITNNKLRISIATDIGPTAALLYIQLLSHRNSSSGKCYPSISILSKETGISERKISELIGELCEYGYLICRSGGRHWANTYWFPCEPFFDPTDVETLMAYRRKSIFGKSVVTKEEAEKEINENKREFAYSENTNNALSNLNKEVKEENKCDDDIEW